MLVLTALPPSPQLHTATEATGIGHILGNKGGAGLSFSLLDGTSLAFCTSHLAARPERVKQRNANYREICQGMHLGGVANMSFTTAFDHVFWFGDLNYRIDRYMSKHPIPLVRQSSLTQPPSATPVALSTALSLRACQLASLTSSQ